MNDEIGQAPDLVGYACQLCYRAYRELRSKWRHVASETAIMTAWKRNIPACDDHLVCSCHPPTPDEIFTEWVAFKKELKRRNE